MKNKKYALELLKKKVEGEIIITYKEIERKTGYSKRQLIRLSKITLEKDIDFALAHGNAAKPPHNQVPNKEIDYIAQFKIQYPVCSISQFMDIYHEDIIFNYKMKAIVSKYNLKQRSYSFFKSLYKKQGWKSPIKHKKFSQNSESHPLREEISPRKGILVMIDGTPHDWFNNGKKQSLHLAIDDATGEALCGWFMATECLEGYCHLLKILITKHGIPESFYSDKYSVFHNEDDEELTQFGRMCEQLGINMIFAGSSEAKGKVERWNFTVQSRLLVDIKRFKIKSVEYLNDWFNSFYCNYLNKKFAYKPLEDDSEFIPLDNHPDLSLIFCRKEKRTILSGNIISWGNCYYQIINDDGQNYPMFKGTEITVLIDIFNPSLVRIEYKKKVFCTKLIPGHRKDDDKRKRKIMQNKKDLEHVLRIRDQRIAKR